MRLQTEKGEIQISGEVFTTITGAVATGCFGVKGMAARSKKDGLVHLHIIVDNGVNLSTISSSILCEFRYAVGRMTGAQVRSVDVYIDSMVVD